MNPHRSLEPFRRDHAEGLVYADLLAASGAVGLPDFRESWHRSMRDHFNEEERLLLPLCDPASGVRLQSDHQQIELLADTAETDEQARRLGRLILDHVRWEEDDLYIRIEHADEATLRSLAEEVQAIERKREHRVPYPTLETGPPMADLRYLADAAPARGPQWGLETGDLNATLLVWQAGEGVPEHVNDEVDVLVVAIEGKGEIKIDGHPFPISAGQTILIPKGTNRSITAKTHRFAHLNVHRRRRKLAVGAIPKREPHGSDQPHP